MRADEAVRQIGRTTFKPGWRFEAESLGGGTIWVSLRVETQDTSYPDPRGEYHVPMTIQPDTILYVGDMDEEALFARLLELAGRIGEHEDREFFRVRQPDGSWKAPFHPHTPEGNDAWQRRERLPR